MKYNFSKWVLDSVVGVVLTTSLALLGCALETETPTTETSNTVGESVSDPSTLLEGAVRKATSIPPGNFANWITIGTGSWGNWLPMTTTQTFCLTGQYAYGASLQAEPGLGAGVDDTAMNGFQILCASPTGSPSSQIVTYWGRFGQFQPWSFSQDPFVDMTSPFTGGKMNIEPGQGSGDDTAANFVVMKRLVGGDATLDHLTGYGTTGSMVSCAAGRAVCGFQVRVEAYGGSGFDDTALNGIRLACCTFP